MSPRSYASDMAEIVVVGGGFAGMSVAARLAKLRHQVVLLEKTSALGGRLLPYEIADHSWGLYPETFTLPGVLRDLFRKSGRTIDKALELTTVGPRVHRFESTAKLPQPAQLALPFGRRGDQLDAVSAALGSDEWSPFVDSLADRWNVFRRHIAEASFIGWTDRGIERDISSASKLSRVARKSLHNELLRQLVTDGDLLTSDSARKLPGWLATWHYVERNFGRWEIAGGFAALSKALTTRLAERRIEVQLNTAGLGITIATDNSVRVQTGHGDLTADQVVWCAPQLPEQFGPVALPSATPLARAFATGLADHSPAALPSDLFVHGRTRLRAWSSDGQHWTIAYPEDVDPLLTLEQFGYDTSQLEAQAFLSGDQVAELGAEGVHWHRFGKRNPGARLYEHPNVHFAGAHVGFGGNVELIGMSTSALASQIGESPRVTARTSTAHVGTSETKLSPSSD